MKSRIFIILAALITLNGCAVVSLESSTPSHKMVYGLDCSGWLNSKNMCYKKAMKLCPHGYIVISDDAPAAPSINVGIRDFAYSLPGVKKALMIQCK